MDFLKYERKYWDADIKYIAGIDEAGRGPLAGPVVAASVIFDVDLIIPGINDSKKLTSKKRLELYPLILEKAISVGVGVVNEDIIDNVNILKATFLAMKKSIGKLNVKPDQIIVDGPYSDIKQFPVECIIDGDKKSHSIAAASIIAKVYRDKLMEQYDIIFPEYNFKNNKGYGTKVHIESLHKYKAIPIHRKSFNIVNNNLPSYAFIKQSYGMRKLASKIIAVKYVKNKYNLIDQDINIENFFIDWFFEKNDILFFIKSYNPKYNRTLIISEKYIDIINKYLLEKDIKSKFNFIVNSVDFFKNKKPVINTIKID